MSSPAVTDLLERVRMLAEVVEDVLVDEAPDGRARWAATLLEALQHVGAASRVEARGEERVGRLDAALAAILRAREAPDRPEALVAVLDEVAGFAAAVRARAVDVAAILVDDPAAADGAPGALRASVGRPQVHTGLELPPPDILPPEATFDPESEVKKALGGVRLDLATVQRWLAEEDEEEEEVDPIAVDDTLFAAPRGTALEITQLHRIARDSLEDIAILGNLRRPEAELPWLFAAHFEDRLLANLDALVALDRPRHAGGASIGVARELWSYLREWTVPDPGRAFAFAFVLACSDREAGPRWIGVTLRRAHGRLAQALEDAIALGSSPHLPTVLAGLLQSETNPGRLRLVLDAWRRHGRVDPIAVLPLLAHPDPEVVGAAIGCLARERTEVAVAALVELLSSEPSLAAEAALALARLGERHGLQHLRAVLAGPLADDGLDLARAVAARAVALLGDPRDAGDLAAFCARRPEHAELLGWHGFPMHVPVLLAALRSADDEVQRQAAGWGLTRLLGSPPGTSLDVGPVLDPSLWQKTVAAADRAVGQRSQLGRPVTSGPTAVRRLADELRAPGTRHRDRTHVLLELELALGKPLGVDLTGWIATQRAVLDAVAAI